MKLGRLITVLAVLVFITANTLYADDVTQRLESIIIETFDDPSERVWFESGVERRQERTWVAQSGNFATVDVDEFTGEETRYPLVAQAPTWPTALFDNNPDGLDLQVLGVMSKFDRQGYNAIEIYPSVPGDEDGTVVPVDIPLPGIVKTIDLWVWGSYYRYDLEIHIRDFNGVPYVLELGNLNFQGWRNLQVDVPTNIPQQQTYLPQYAGLVLTKMVVRTQPDERVDINYVYFDQIKILTDMHENPYDGRDLTRPGFLDEVWGSN